MFVATLQLATIFDRMKAQKITTIRNYAKSQGVTTQYIYDLILSGKMESVKIDGIQFIDANKYPTLPTRSK